MTESMRFRFGRIDLPQSKLPSPEELYNAIDDEFRIRKEEKVVEGADLDAFMEKGMSPYLSDEHGEYTFCQFTYISDKEDSVVVRNEDELEERPSDEVVRPLVFYFKNGQFAFESEQGLVKHWIPQYIGERTDTDVEGNYSFDSFSQDVMKEYYDTRDHISVFRFGAPEDTEFEGDSELARALNELAEDVQSQEFSGGNSGKNLKGVEIVDEAAEKMRIEKLHGARDDGYTTNLLASGVFVPVWSEEEWPTDAGQERRAETIFQRLTPYLRKLA